MKSEYDRWKNKVIFLDKESCWEWKGARYRNGYGHFRRFLNNKWTMGKAHRFSYEYYNNLSTLDIKGLVVCHTCDNPSCVNPNHLFIGSHQDNINDAVNKKRNSFGRNSKHSWLSLDIAKQMRKLYKDSNLTYAQLGKLFNTSSSQAHRVIKNLIWKE